MNTRCATKSIDDGDMYDDDDYKDNVDRNFIYYDYCHGYAIFGQYNIIETRETEISILIDFDNEQTVRVAKDKVDVFQRELLSAFAHSQNRVVFPRNLRIVLLFLEKIDDFLK
jgi:hypothetical protein